MSSTPSLLGFICCIRWPKPGKSLSILSLFHCRLSVRRSDTLRSITDSWMGPKGLVWVLSDIHQSFQILVFSPFPMAFPRFSWRRSLPCRILRHPWEQTAGTLTSRKLFLWQYLPVSTLANKQFGAVNILHAIFASNAWLKIWISLSPSPPVPFGFVNLSQANQHIPFLSGALSHQKRVKADFILLQRLCGSLAVGSRT